MKNNQAACNIICEICKSTFICTASKISLQDHMNK